MFFWGSILITALFSKNTPLSHVRISSGTSLICTLCSLLSHYYNFLIKIRRCSSAISGHQKSQSSCLICKSSHALVRNASASGGCTWRLSLRDNQWAAVLLERRYFVNTLLKLASYPAGNVTLDIILTQVIS